MVIFLHFCWKPNRLAVYHLFVGFRPKKKLGFFLADISNPFFSKTATHQIFFKPVLKSANPIIFIFKNILPPPHTLPLICQAILIVNLEPAKLVCWISAFLLILFFNHLHLPSNLPSSPSLILHIP